MRVVQGEVFDVAVDLRKSSPTFGRHVSVIFSAKNKQQLWIPPGFAHRLYVLSETAEFFDRCTDYYAPEHERTLNWGDSSLAIPWQLQGAGPTVSLKDRQGRALADAEC